MVPSRLLVIVAVSSPLARPLLVIPVVVSPMLVLFLFRFILTSNLHQDPALGRIFHHSLVGCLLLLLDHEHRIRLDFRCRVPRCVRILRGHESILLGVFLHGFCRITLDQAV